MRRPISALVAVALLFAVPIGASEPPEGPRVVAIGDIHGELTVFRKLLEETGLIDAAGNWTGGTTILVQTGDYLDRGPDVAAVMDLLMDLQEKSATAGGQVHVLLGNHEAMNLAFEYRDVGAAAYDAFVTSDSEDRRKQAYKAWRSHILGRARRLGVELPVLDRTVRKQWMAQHPPGLLEYREALGPQGRYGTWVRQRPVAIRVGDSLLLHAGIGPDSVGRTLEEINQTAREESRTLDSHRDFLVARGLALPFFDRAALTTAARQEVELRAARGSSDPLETERLREIAVHLEGLTLEADLLRAEGPLWYRGYALTPEPQLVPVLEETLASYDVRRVVGAHNTLASARIQPRLDGRIYLIDTGMLSSYYPGGRGSALEIDGGTVTAVYEDGARVDLTAAAQQQAPVAERWLGPDGAFLPFGEDDELLAFLRTARVLEIREIGEGVTRPERALLEDRGVRARAVFHDVHIEKSQARLAGAGFVTHFRDSYLNQVAAYEVARLLRLDNVPPAVVREVNGREGSLALWIEGAMNERERKERQVEPPDRTRWVRGFHDMRVFDNLINNIDRNEGNILLDSEWGLWLIDHTRAFGQNKKLPSPDVVRRCSRELFTALRGLTEEGLTEQLAPYLTPFKIRTLLERRDRLVELIEQLIAEKGEHHVLFDWQPPSPTAAATTADGARRR